VHIIWRISIDIDCETVHDFALADSFAGRLPLIQIATIAPAVTDKFAGSITQSVEQLTYSSSFWDSFDVWDSMNLWKLSSQSRLQRTTIKIQRHSVFQGLLHTFWVASRARSTSLWCCGDIISSTWGVIASCWTLPWMWRARLARICFKVTFLKKGWYFLKCFLCRYVSNTKSHRG
jgi:hypothetical protein